MRFDSYEAYDKWFTSEYDQTRLEEGAQEIGPFLSFTIKPNLPPWKLEWFIVFGDRKYLRLYEYFDSAPKEVGGGIRAVFSFHYGDLPPQIRNGKPAWRDHDQVDLRIDLDQSHGLHLHFRGEDHIAQDRVKGFEFEAYDLFKYISVIKEHRQTQRPLDEILGFVVEAAK